MTLLGIVIGLWVKAEVVQGLTTLALLVLSMLGGLWFPVELMPSAMQSVAHALPSYWLAELGRYPFLPGGDFPGPGVWVLLGLVAGADSARRAGLSSGCGHQQALTEVILRTDGRSRTRFWTPRFWPRGPPSATATTPTRRRAPSRASDAAAPGRWRRGSQNMIWIYVVRPGLPVCSVFGSAHR